MTVGLLSAMLFSCAGAKKPTSMTVLQAPDTLKVVQGEEPDFSGGIVEIEFENGSVKEVAMSELEYEGLNVDALGEQTVVFSYTAKKKTVSVSLDFSVVAPKVTSITLNADNVKTQYVEGASFDKTGLVVTATYQTGATATVGAYEITPLKLTAETTSVKVTYRGASATIPVTVARRAPLSAEILTLPNKVTYFVGEAFLPEGTSMKVVNNDGTTETFTSDELEFFDSVGSAKYTVASLDNVVRVVASARYGEVGTTMTITVREIAPTSVTLLSPLTAEGALCFSEGESFSFYDEDAVSVRIEYNNGDTEVVGGSSDYLEYSEDPLTTEQTFVTVWVIGYPSLSVNIPVSVLAPTATGMVVLFSPTNCDYSVGDAVDLSGLKIRVSMSDGTTRTIEYSSESGITCSPDVIGAEDTSVTVHYLGFSSSFPISVAE